MTTDTLFRADPPAPAAAAIAPRPPATVMRLSRLGSAHPMRLSFLRQFLRRTRDEDWRFDRTLWQVDDRGVGRACYRLQGPARSYTLVAFAHDLPPGMRSDRVIATAWDATFALFDGEPTPADLDRLAANVPLQEAGRISRRELSLSRANRSVRLFDHVVARLAAGRQPDRAEIEAVGYLMRTTAVYGAGKFGAADRADYADRPELRAPFQAEMMSVWLTRAFTIDLAEHLAAARGGAAAVRLDPALRRMLGVGNSTGLGLAPFLIRHPTLLHNWIAAREQALARVRAQPGADPAAVAGFRAAVAAAIANAALWHSEHPLQIARLDALRADLARIAARDDWSGPQPWDGLWLWGEACLSEEGQEALLAAMLEPHGALIDDLGAAMAADEDAAFALDGVMTAGQMRGLIARDYPWALGCDFADPAATARFWYVSEEKLEPRLGDRHAEAGAGREQPLGIARAVAALDAALAARPPDEPLALSLAALPDHRHTARRVQMAARHPYAEIRDNLLAAGMLPIDILRLKLAFFGASRFDPRSDKWVRISLFQNEDAPDDLPPAAAGTAGLTLSRTETRALALKAARGAGLPWGLAEEAAMAAEWLAGRGVGGLGLLAGWLPRRAAAACPVAAGVAFCDRPPAAPADLGAVAAPALLLPFVAALAARTGRRPGLATAAGRWLGLAELAAQGGAAPAGGLVLHPDGAPADLSHGQGRAAVSAEDLAVLEALALQTTVPPSGRSRDDAGAGMLDND